MLDDILAECVMIVVTLGFRSLGRLKAHVVPAEVLEAVADLAEALRPHGRASSTLAGKKSGGKRSERLGFGHLHAPLLTDDAAAETADRTRTGRGNARRGSRRRKHRPAKILFEAVRNIVPKLDDFLGRAAIRINFHHRAAVDHRG